MGHPVKLSDRSKTWFKSKPCRKRRTNTRGLRIRFLIVCEGEKTEPNYFDSFKQDLPPHVVQLEIYGTGYNTVSLCRRAREIRDDPTYQDYPFDQVWVVFDRDSFEADQFDNAIQMAEADGMRCAWSNEAFELWYILHFEYRNTPMSRAEYSRRLDDLLREPYRKNSPDMYEKLSHHGDQANAITYAKRLSQAFIGSRTPPSRSNPCTTVFELITQLNSLRTKQ